MFEKMLKASGVGRGNRGRRRFTGESGVTLIETMIAAAILIIVVVGLLPVFVMGIETNQQQGDVATRTTEYAQDKMESLINLSFTDGATNTTVYPPATAGGTGLGGTLAASTSAGSIPPSAAVTGYVDYLDANGNLLTSSVGAYYSRQWSILADSTGTLKTITVVASSLQITNVHGVYPSTTLVCIKSNGL
jgi:type II secretory pathway pseudopilin PulG